MAPLISSAILLAATLASFSLALLLARLGLAAMFRILLAARPPSRVISGGRTRAHVGAGLSRLVRPDDVRREDRPMIFSAAS